MERPNTPAFAIFSGGGAQGIALAGAYQAALDSGFEFKGFGGTSAGAMIAIMAATGMSGNDIVSQSLPNRPGHPSNFFSDTYTDEEKAAEKKRRKEERSTRRKKKGAPKFKPTEKRLRFDQTERRLSQLLHTWELAQPRRKRNKKSEYLEDIGKAFEKRWPSNLSRVQKLGHMLFLTLGATIVSAAVAGSAALILYAVATGRSAGEIVTWLDATDESGFESVLKISFLVLLLLFVGAFVLRLMSSTRNFPIFTYLFLRRKGKYWKWVWGLLSKRYGFLRGDGMKRAFDTLFEERIITNAARKNLPQFLDRKFSTLSFNEFERLFGVPIKIVASDLWSGKPIVFDSHDYGDYHVFDAVRASTAFPLAFEPVIARSKANSESGEKIAHVLVDGGLSSNSPAFLYKRESDFSRIPTIAFQLNYSYPGPNYPEDLLAYFNSLTRTAVGAGDTIIQGLVPRMHVVSVSGLEEYGVLDGDLSQKALLRLFELGRARQDDLIRIWKVCRIERKDGGEPKSELGPVMESIRQLLSKHVGQKVTTAIGLWVPHDHKGHQWRVLYKDGIYRELEIGRMFDFKPDEEHSLDEPDGNTTTDPKPSAQEQLRRSAQFCAATAHHALYTREFAADNAGPHGFTMALPIPSYTLEPDTWMRGRDIVAVLSMVATWGNGAPALNTNLTASPNDSSSTAPDYRCGWFREPTGHDPNEESVLHPELAAELGRWEVVLSRLMAA